MYCLKCKIKTESIDIEEKITSNNNQKNYSYCRPGTKYEHRNRESYKGINELGSMCKIHDKFWNINTDTASRNISDEALAHRSLEILMIPGLMRNRGGMQDLLLC